jgi:hypothetical protein
VVLLGERVQQTFVDSMAEILDGKAQFADRRKSAVKSQIMGAKIPAGDVAHSAIAPDPSFFWRGHAKT